MYLVLSAFTSSPISLVAAIKAYAFFFTVCMLPPKILSSSTQARSWCVPFNFNPSWSTRTLLMAYSKAKLKSNGDRASPCFKPLLIGNMSDKFLPTLTLPFKEFTSYLYVVTLFHFVFMTCMHSSVITYFLTNLHIHELLSTFVCTETHNIYYTFEHLPHLRLFNKT